MTSRRARSRVVAARRRGVGVVSIVSASSVALVGVLRARRRAAAIVATVCHSRPRAASRGARNPSSRRFLFGSRDAPPLSGARVTDRRRGRVTDRRRGRVTDRRRGRRRFIARRGGARGSVGRLGGRSGRRAAGAAVLRDVRGVRLARRQAHIRRLRPRLAVTPQCFARRDPCAPPSPLGMLVWQGPSAAVAATRCHPRAQAASMRPYAHRHLAR